MGHIVAEEPKTVSWSSQPWKQMCASFSSNHVTCTLYFLRKGQTAKFQGPDTHLRIYKLMQVDIKLKMYYPVTSCRISKDFTAIK